VFPQWEYCIVYCNRRQQSKWPPRTRRGRRCSAGLARLDALCRVDSVRWGAMLHGVTGWETWMYPLVPGLMIVVVLAASFIPAWQALLEGGFRIDGGTQ
jgi:hypothetical protein